MVKGCFSKVLAEPRLLKLNFGIMCLHIMLMSTFVALPGQLEAAGFPAAEHWKIYLVTMVISFISVVPFIIYAEVKRKMKRVFLLCVAILLIAEIVLWGAGGYFWELVAGVQLFFLAFNLLEALLPSLISKESPAGYKGTAMGVYSTSQFLGVAIGGALGGWVDGFFDSQTVFLLGALLAMLWLLVASTMSEPPYVSSLRVEVPDGVVVDSALQARLLSASGGSSGAGGTRGAFGVYQNRQQGHQPLRDRAAHQRGIKKAGNSPLFCCLPAALVAEVFELERLSQIATAHQRHHRLQIVAGLTGHADLFTLNLGLHFQLAVFDQFNDLLLHRAFNALLQLRFNKPGFTAVHDIFRYVEGGAFNAALEQLGAQDIQQLVHLEVRLAQHFNGLVGVV